MCVSNCIIQLFNLYTSIAILYGPIQIKHIFLERLLRLQKRGARIILKRKITEVSSEQLFKELGWLPPTERWTFHKCLQVFRCINDFCPSYLLNLFSRNSVVHNYKARGRRNIHLNRIISKSGSRSFCYAAADLFNDLPNHVKNSESIRSFTSNYYWCEKWTFIILVICISPLYLFIYLVNLFIYKYFVIILYTASM